MKKSLSNDISRVEENKRIQKMFDAYNQVIGGIVIFYVVQFVLWCAII